MKKLLCIDPGMTTGVCVFSYDDKTFSVYYTADIPMSDIDTLEVLFREVDEVLYEEFRLYAHKATDLIYNEFPSSEVIGLIKHWSRKYGLPYQGQMASAMNKKVNKIQDEHKKHFVRLHHARDAYRHGRIYILKRIMQK